MGRSFLFVPSLRRGNGTGHLRRCLALMRAMDSLSQAEKRVSPGASNYGAGGPSSADLPELFLYLPEELRRSELLTIIEDYRIDSARILSSVDELPRPFSDFVVVDRRATGAEEYELFSSLGVPVGIDEGGETRGSFPLLIDTFPLPAEFAEANIADPALLDLPPKVKAHPSSFTRLLVSFGGEDPARLTEGALEALSALVSASAGTDIGWRRWECITVVEGPLFGRSVAVPDMLASSAETGARTGAVRDEAGRGGAAMPQLQVIRAPDSLFPLYSSHDIVLTAFGLTAYEAAAAGASVILFHPSPYHRRLARNAGFAAAEGVGRVDVSELSRLLAGAEEVAERSAAAAPKGRRSMARLLSRLEPPALNACPVCRSKRNRAALLREGKRSFFRCSDSGLIYQIDFSERKERYGKEYFFEEYRAQYGKSYLEDAAHIRALARPRLRNIDSLLPRSAGKNVRLLDVGCAYGPFLQEAMLRGYRASGMDISAAAVTYVREEIGLPAFRLDFSADPLPDFSRYPVQGEESPVNRLAAEAQENAGLFDVVSMWYVIEHFDRLDAVLGRVSFLLKPGGLFCFSTPGEQGVSGRFAFRDFLRSSPKDHHTLWSPRSAETILRRYGFRVEKRVSTGHHPERFPLVPDKGPIYHIVMVLSKMLHMGDSFEIYARKVGGAQ